MRTNFRDIKNREIQTLSLSLSTFSFLPISFPRFFLARIRLFSRIKKMERRRKERKKKGERKIRRGVEKNGGKLFELDESFLFPREMAGFKIH